MSKFLDIHPVKKSTAIDNKTKPKQNSGLIFFVFTIIGVLVLINSTSNPPKKIEKTNNTQKSVNSPSPVLNDSTPQKNSVTLPDPPNSENSDSTLNNESKELSSNENNVDKTNISIRMLDGSKTSDKLQILSDKLENDGFIVATTGKAVNYYRTTIVYYKKDRLNDANLIANSLKDYNVSTNENNTLVGNYDVLVVVGKE